MVVKAAHAKASTIENTLSINFSKIEFGLAAYFNAPES
jgi:hypothetical protein